MTPRPDFQRRRRPAVYLLAAALAVPGVVARQHPAGAAQSSTAVPWTTDRNPDAEQWRYDDDRDGWTDRMLLDVNNDGRPDTYLYNSRGDESLLETVALDMNQDGVQDARCWDADGRAGFDQCMIYSGSRSWSIDLHGQTTAPATVQVGGGYYDPSTAYGPRPDFAVVGGGYYDPSTAYGSRPDVVVVGGAQLPSGVPGLLIALAGATGKATFGSGDRDHDNVADVVDAYPDNPTYR